MRGPHVLTVLATLTGVALVGRLPAGAQAPVACNPSADVPAYSYTEILDAADVPSLQPIVPRMNDLGDVAILVPFGDEAGLNARRCLARHSNRVTRTVLCTQSVDPASDVNRLEATLFDLDLDINNRGTIVITSGRVGSSLHRILVVPRNGPHTLSDVEGFPQEIDDRGNVAFSSPPSGDLRGALAGGGFVDIAAASLSFGGVPSPGGGSAGEALVGFDYAVAPGAPRFASVQVPFPLADGQEAFLLEVGAASFPLAAGEQFDLTTVDLEPSRSVASTPASRSTPRRSSPASPSSRPRRRSRSPSPRWCPSRAPGRRA
jgi:hypothetical protein